MRPASFFSALPGPLAWLLAAGLLVGLAAGARAQVPAQLVGQWEMRQISFLAEHAVPDSVLARMDNPQVASLNQEIRAGSARLAVEFRPDGTYLFTITRAGRTERTEAGTYAVQHNTLLSQSPTTEGGSSFNDQYLAKLSGRTLLLTFRVGPELPDILEEVEYRRLRP